jgi:hypothetical protein
MGWDLTGDGQLLDSVDACLLQSLRDAVDQTSDIDGWSHVSKVGHYISEAQYNDNKEDRQHD